MGMTKKEHVQHEEAILSKQVKQNRATLTEKTLIDTVLETCNGNVTKSADFLGISRGTLIKRIKEYNLKIK